ncbi:MAG: hypothetical protein ACI9MB_002387, partial [Verrucomicrobiales bacterium]
MKIPHQIRLLSGLLVLWVAMIHNAMAQNPQRFMVEPRDVANAQHRDLVDTVAALGGDIYVDVDFPEVGGNMVGVLLDPEAAADLRNTRPDLVVIQDQELRPDGRGGGVPWSPDRIDQRVGTDGLYQPPMIKPCEGNRPFVYICDTGVLATHTEFTTAGSRLGLTSSYVPAMLPRVSTAWQDPWDHGTGVAGCAVGETLGAGRCPANLISAVCYPDPGTIPGVAGSFASFAADVIYWSLNEHNQRATDGDPFNDASVLVFASSTTTGPSAILDLAVQRAYLGGMTVVVSAGNKNLDVMNISPAGATTTGMGDITLTVAASSVLDTRWANSNYGARVELFAPGENVLTASTGIANPCLVRSGTSFSAGYAAGAAARILSRNPWASPTEVVSVLTDASDTTYGPSGPFGVGMNGIQHLLFVHQSSVICIPLLFPVWMDFFEADPAVPDDDPDCDGFVNAVEYAMALNPSGWITEDERPKLVLEDGGALYQFRKADYLCDQ